MAPDPAGPVARIGERPGPTQSGVDAPRPANSALAELGVDAETLRRIEGQRPWLVARALLTGATPQQVVAVLGWELDELRFAIGRWASTLRDQGQLTQEQAAALQARVHGSR